MVVLFLIFWGTSTLFSIVAVPFYIPTDSVQWFQFLHILANIVIFFFFFDNGVYYQIVGVSYIFVLLAPYYIYMVCKYFLPFHRLPFHSVDSILWYTKVLNLDVVLSLLKSETFPRPFFTFHDIDIFGEYRPLFYRMSSAWVYIIVSSWFCSACAFLAGTQYLWCCGLFSASIRRHVTSLSCHWRCWFKSLN